MFSLRSLIATLWAETQGGGEGGKEGKEALRSVVFAFSQDVLVQCENTKNALLDRLVV